MDKEENQNNYPDNQNQNTVEDVEKLEENLDTENKQEADQNPKEEIKKLLSHCELEWDENCLNHHNNTRSIKTVSSMQARKPIYKTKNRAVEPYLKYLKPLEEILNY